MSKRLSILTIALFSLCGLSLAAYVKNSLSKDASPQNDLPAVAADATPVAASGSTCCGMDTSTGADATGPVAATGSTCCGGGTTTSFDVPSLVAANGSTCCGAGASTGADATNPVVAAESTCCGTGAPTGADAKSPVAAAESTDKGLIAKQKICPVTGAPLGSMGNPVKVVVKDRTVFLCCAGCKAKFLAATDTYLKKLDEKK
ncbi:MAG: hypothetical protein ACLQNE_25155 [Thermoguttaceae bacterium]